MRKLFKIGTMVAIYYCSFNHPADFAQFLMMAHDQAKIATSVDEKTGETLFWVFYRAGHPLVTTNPHLDPSGKYCSLPLPEGEGY